MHGIGLLNGGYGLLPHMPDLTGDPEVQAFLREREPVRQKLLEQIRTSEEYQAFASDDQIWTNYKLMEVFDLMAQFICNRYPLNSTERRNGPTNIVRNVPVAPDQDDVTLTIDVQDEQRAIIRPYPLDVEPLEIQIPARLIPDRP